MKESSNKAKHLGLTCLIDGGVPKNQFIDYVESFSDYISYVKFGWGTGLVTKNLNEKIACLNSNGIKHWFGGTLFEYFYIRNNVEEYLSFIDRYNTEVIEVSDGTIDLPQDTKLSLISSLANSYQIMSEVGSKDSDNVMSPSEWVKCIKAEQEAGAKYVITEGRESGAAGIYRASGEVRQGLVQDILNAEIDINKLIFEAPQKQQQLWFMKNIGLHVNLGNIPFESILNVETMRRGLRSDTFNEVYENDSVSLSHSDA